MSKNALIFAMFFLLTACSPSVLQIDAVQKKSDAPALVKSNTRWFWGMSGTSTIPADKVCGAHGLNSIETRNDGINGTLNFFTGGIYMPAEYAFYCNK